MSRSAKPPRWPGWLLTLALRGEPREVVIGDLDEEFHERLACGDSPRDARRHYVRQAMASIAAMSRADLKSDAPIGHHDGAQPRRWRLLGDPPRWRDDVRWAWRGVVGRQWRAVLVVGLLAVAIAANTMVFTVADASIFNPYPYPQPERVVTLKETLPQGTFLTKAQSAQRLKAWADQPDIFAATGSALRKTVFVTMSGPAERVSAADITIGFLDVLGVKPQWGRPFLPGDEAASEFVILISPNLARRYFGSPMQALGQVLELSAGPHRIVGVMPDEFAYPSASFEIWRALDLTGPLTRNHGSVEAMARTAPALTNDDAARRVAERAPGIGATIGAPGYAVVVTPALPKGTFGTRDGMLFVLLGAALCLLLATSANVASLELAASIARARTHAIQLALGASRASLARVAALEGVMLVGAAIAIGLGLAWMSMSMLIGLLPTSFSVLGQNRIGLDLRAFGYTGLVAFVAWISAALAPVVAASRPNLVALLRIESRSAALSPGSVRLRQVLTAAEVAVAVTLVIGGLLYARSYRDLLAVEKGFDSSGLADLSWDIPYSRFSDRAATRERLTAAVAALPGVLAVSTSSPPPSLGDSPSPSAIEIDGQPPVGSPVYIGAKWVDAAFFKVIQLPVRSGRTFSAGDLSTDVVVSETFAKRFWPGTDAVGHTFRLSPKNPWNRVVGVVGNFRTASKNMPTLTDRQVFYYRFSEAVAPPPATPPPPPTARPAPAQPPARVIDTGGVTGYLTIMVRLDSPNRTSQILAAARAMDPGLRAAIELVDDRYARQNAETRLVSHVVGGFSVLAFLVAIAGVYGLMVFLVSTRRREIGVRIALGADRTAITRLVFGSAARLVLIGAGLGIAGAVIASRRIASSLFGVTATDPLTYSVVVGSVAIAALLATWHPARHAARVDPALLLKAD